MPPVAAITPILNPCVARITPVLYAINNTKSVANVSPIASMAMPGYDFSNMAEMPPSANPSSNAYSGAVIGAQLRLKMVTSAVTIPPNSPPIIHGMAAPGVSECAKPQVHAAVATTHSSSSPVLFTVPCKVIASPPTATSPRKAFSFSAGFEVRNGLAMFNSLDRTHSVYACENRPANPTPQFKRSQFQIEGLQPEEW